MRAANPGQATIAGASLAGLEPDPGPLRRPPSSVTIAARCQRDDDRTQPDHRRRPGHRRLARPRRTTCNDTTIIGNQLIGPFGEDAIHLNRYHDADGDGVGILIEGNEITNVRENGNHSDCLQTVWVGDHIVFRKNYLHDNRCQGFFVKDQASLGGVSGPIDGITVEDNLFVRNNEPCGAPLTSCGQPMYFQVFGPYTGFVMRRNTIWGDGGDSIATFREGTGSDSQIANNVIYRLWTDTNMSAGDAAPTTPSASAKPARAAPGPPRDPARPPPAASASPTPPPTTTASPARTAASTGRRPNSITARDRADLTDSCTGPAGEKWRARRVVGT